METMTRTPPAPVNDATIATPPLVETMLKDLELRPEHPAYEAVKARYLEAANSGFIWRTLRNALLNYQVGFEDGLKARWHWLQIKIRIGE